MTEGTEAITTLHFVWMGLLALLVVIAIIAGVRKQRRRAEAEREVVAHAEEAGVEPPPLVEAGVPEGSSSTIPPPSLPDQRPFGTPAEAPGPLADEPVAAAIAPDGTAATIAADADAPGVPSPADGSITQLKGLGPKVAARLAELGIHRVGQIAVLDEAGAVALDAEMGPFAGRLSRDRWIEQARLLAAGDREGFERVFGKL